MSTLTKAFIVVMLVLSLAVAVATASLFAQKTSWYKKYSDAQGEIDRERAAAEEAKQDARDRIAANEEKLRDEVNQHMLTKGERDKAVADLKALNTAHSDLRAELAQLTAILEEAQRNIADLNTRTNRVEEQLAMVKTERDDAIKEKMEAIADAVHLEKLVAAKEDQLRAMERMYGNLERKWRQAEGEEVAPENLIQGTITTIREGLYAVSVGSDDNVQDGDEFTVYRGGTYVSRIRILRASRDVAVAREMKEYRNEPESIMVGDNVSNAIR